ncbi:transcription intermediary factor 1-beta-like [Mytilus trossulus]|uniref:transcription intermediary factor 1-beta-like n=1 Tax=Mytilus trossulus TaxID=6551 RepID=UPI0030063B38
MAQSAVKICDICVSAPGSCYCLSCEQRFCEHCKALHKRQKISMDHQFEGSCEELRDETSRCSDHDENFIYICTSCDTPVCRHCVTDKHNGHRMSELQDSIYFLKEKLAAIDLTIGEASQHVVDIEKGLKVYDRSIESVKRAIRNEGDKVKSLVDKYIDQQIDTLKQSTKSEKKKLKKNQTDNKIFIEKANAWNNRKIKILKQQKDTMTDDLKSLIEEVDGIQAVPIPAFPSIHYTITPVSKEDVASLIGTYKISQTKCGIEQYKHQSQKSVQQTTFREEGMFLRCKLCGGERIVSFE